MQEHSSSSLTPPRTLCSPTSSPQSSPSSPTPAPPRHLCACRRLSGKFSTLSNSCVVSSVGLPWLSLSPRFRQGTGRARGGGAGIVFIVKSSRPVIIVFKFLDKGHIFFESSVYLEKHQTHPKLFLPSNCKIANWFPGQPITAPSA